MKPVIWVGSSRKDVRRFPASVRGEIGQALFVAQLGDRDPAVKTLKGFGGGSVLEVVTNQEGDTWRMVYTIRFEDAIYVLHAFQKKSKRGSVTPQRELEIIRARLAEVERRRRSSK